MNVIVSCNPYGEFEVWINESSFKTVIYKHFGTFREAEDFARAKCRELKRVRDTCL